MAEQNEAEIVAEQESPTAENIQPEEVVETESEAPKEDKNWKALREELEEKKRENAILRGEQTSPLANTRTDTDKIYLASDELLELNKGEVKAELKFPELETKNIFSRAVAGEYRAQLDQYVRGKSLGLNPKLPSVYEIAKQIKAEYDSSFSTVSKKSEEEGAKKAQKSVATREATLEVESRSDRGRASGDDFGKLQDKSRHGDFDAVAERLAKSGL